MNIENSTNPEDILKPADAPSTGESPSDFDETDLAHESSIDENEFDSSDGEDESAGESDVASADSENELDSRGIRLQKVLAAAGLGSRRDCEGLITAGRIAVDGQIVSELGTRVDTNHQRITCDGQPVLLQRRQYFIVNKPKGVLCTNNDPDGRPRVIDLFPRKGPRLFTVGRLDESSEGLLIVTNDGDLAQRLAHPRFGIERRYRAQVAGRPTPETLDTLRRGLYFSDGKFWVKHVHIEKTIGQSTILEIVLTQGRNREIRRLLARVGHKVMHLQRIAFGPLRLGRLKPGQIRELKTVELKELKGLLSGEPRQFRRSSNGRRPLGRREKREQIDRTFSGSRGDRTGGKGTRFGKTGDSAPRGDRKQRVGEGRSEFARDPKRLGGKKPFRKFRPSVEKESADHSTRRPSRGRFRSQDGDHPVFRKEAPKRQGRGLPAGRENRRHQAPADIAEVQGDSSFARGDRRPKRFDRRPKRFDRGPQKFDRGDKKFERGTKSFRKFGGDAQETKTGEGFSGQRPKGGRRQFGDNPKSSGRKRFGDRNQTGGHRKGGERRGPARRKNPRS